WTHFSKGPVGELQYSSPYTMAYLLDCLIIDLAKALSFGKALELRNLAIGSIQLAPMSVEINIEWNFDSNIDFPLFEI
ncbi:hypothetical protein FRX31_013644, partial [Thalictrum thalictroides]